MTPFWGWVMRKEETAFCPGEFKVPILKAKRRFFLPPYEPKQHVIPNPFIRQCP